MAKAGRRKRSQRRDAKRKDKDIELEEDEEEEFDELKTRKRSQAAIKQQMSQKKKDRIVLVFAAIFIIITLIVLSYFQFFATSDDNDSVDEQNGVTGPGNYTATIHVISHATHQYGKSSWHLLNVNGLTNFMIRVINTGTREDTYKLAINNLETKIKVELDDNNFILKPNKSKLIIADVTTTMGTEYRLPTPIDIDLVSGFTKSVLDSIQIDVTIKRLDTDEVIIKDDKASAYYTGAFGTNGTLFDYSLKDPEMKDPLYLSLSDDVQTDNFESRQYTPVIPGFKNGVIGMVPGETQVIIVPPELGYPNDHFLGGTTLIFEVYVVSNDRNA
jgi:hypothetical protein